MWACINDLRRASSGRRPSRASRSRGDDLARGASVVHSDRRSGPSFAVTVSARTSIGSPGRESTPPPPHNFHVRACSPRSTSARRGAPYERRTSTPGSSSHPSASETCARARVNPSIHPSTPLPPHRASDVARDARARSFAYLLCRTRGSSVTGSFDASASASRRIASSTLDALDGDASSSLARSGTRSGVRSIAPGPSTSDARVGTRSSADIARVRARASAARAVVPPRAPPSRERVSRVSRTDDDALATRARRGGSER